MHGAAMALEAGVAESDNVAGADLVVLLYGCVCHVNVDEGAKGTDANREEGIWKSFQEVKDQGVGRTVTDGAILLGVGTFGDSEAETFVGVLELILTGAGRRWLVALFQAYICGILGVETSCHYCLRVIQEEDVYIL